MFTKLKRKLARHRTSSRSRGQKRDKTDAEIIGDAADTAVALEVRPKPSSQQLLPERTIVDVRELWNIAYEKLREDNEALVLDYEAKLNDAMNAAPELAASAGASKTEQMEAILQHKMSEISRNAWKLRFGSSDVQVKDMVQPVLGVVNWVNGFVTKAVSANPTASLAWAGVSLLVPLLLNPSEQGASLAEGLQYVSSLIAQSQLWEDLYCRKYAPKDLDSPPPLPPSQYIDALEILYGEILKFQITSYCHYAKHSAFRLGLDTIKWNDWEQMLDEIREQERALSAVNAIWKDSKYDEECLAAERRHQETMNGWNAIATDISGLRSAVEKAQKDQDRIKILEWLCQVDPSSMYNVARDKHASGTGDWLLNDSAEFKAWETCPRSFVWLHGKAGCGKSILSSSVIRHLRLRHAPNPETALAYFYFSFSDLEKQKVDRMLASLIKQLCVRRPDTPAPVRSLMEYKEKGERPDIRTLEATLISTANGFSTIHIVIDALDECPTVNGERRKLLDSISRIISAGLDNVHIICTSRQEPDIETVLGSLVAGTPRAVINLTLEENLLREDIGLYLDSTLSSSDFDSWPKQIKAQVRESLIEKSDCMFQYVVCQLEVLRQLSSAGLIRKALKELPAGLDDTYDRMLLSVSPSFRPQVVSALKWLSFCQRDMAVSQLAEAFVVPTELGVPIREVERLFRPEDVLKYLSGLIVTFEVGGDLARSSRMSISVPKRVPSSPSDLKSDIESGSNVGNGSEIDLVSIVQSDADEDNGARSQSVYLIKSPDEIEWGRFQKPISYVRLAHFSVQEYLTSSRIAEGSTAMFSFSETDAHIHIAEACTGFYLQSFTDIPRPLYQTDLISYADRYLWEHIEMIPQKLWPSTLRRALLRTLTMGNPAFARIASKWHDGPSWDGNFFYTTYLPGFRLILDDLEAPVQRPCSFTASYGFVELTKLLVSHNKYLTQDDLDYALINASFTGRTAVMKLLLDNGANSDAKRGSPLIAAVRGGHEATIRLLLERGADPNPVNRQGFTCLEAAGSAHRSIHYLNLLLSHGANLHDPITQAERLMCLVSCDPRDISIMLRFLQANGVDTDNPQLFRHLFSRHLQHFRAYYHKFNFLLERGVDMTPIVKALDDYGPLLALFCHAARPLNPDDIYTGAGRKKNLAVDSECRNYMIKTLLKFGADINAVGDSALVCALHAACYHLPDCFMDNDISIVEYLISQGANVNQKAGVLCTPLQAACASYIPDRRAITSTITSLLKAGADVNIQGGKYGSALRGACINADISIVKLLLDHGTDTHAGLREHGSVLQAVSRRQDGLTQDDEDIQIFELLVARGVDVNEQGGCLHTPLQAVVSSASERTKTRAIWLIEHGADVSIEGGEYRTMIQAACSAHDNAETVQLLLNHGANPHQRGGHFGSPWHAAASNLTRSMQETLELLLEHGVDVNDSCGTQYATALEAALRTDIWDGSAMDKPFPDQWLLSRLEFLLDHGVDANIGSEKYGSPLHSACSHAISERLGLFLLERWPNVDVNAQGGPYGSALQAAAHLGRFELVRALVERGADVNARGGKYLCAMNAAIVCGSWYIVEFLLEKGAIPDCDWMSEPDEEWLERVRGEGIGGEGAVARYLKFWEVQTAERRAAE